MKIETLEVTGFYTALTGMRDPMDSWEKSDTAWHNEMSENAGIRTVDFLVGSADRDLSVRLQKAGPEHCKHLRMIHASADIWAPRYWWIEMDTYRHGVEKVSCSTMHRLMARPLTTDDFEVDDKDSPGFQIFLQYLIDSMNEYKELDDPEEKKALWKHIIQMLPQSYIQRRTIQFSYAALRNIYRQREGHKLREWEMFREWVDGLPEAWMITE